MDIFLGFYVLFTLLLTVLGCPLYAGYFYRCMCVERSRLLAGADADALFE